MYFVWSERWHHLVMIVWIAMRISLWLYRAAGGWNTWTLLVWFKNHLTGHLKDNCLDTLTPAISTVKSLFTEMGPGSIVTCCPFYQGRAVEAVEGASTRCPGETLCATLALCCIITWTLGPCWLACTIHIYRWWQYSSLTVIRNLCPLCSESLIIPKSPYIWWKFHFQIIAADDGVRQGRAAVSLA